MAFKEKRRITDESLQGIIIMYCEEYDMDIDEVGQDIKKDKKFAEALKYDLINRNQARFEDQIADVTAWIK
ncbi:MAG: hypothetical protein KAI79_13995 [Bacteroidales bacterium]|nr:hypothetical protein [Bacteroidales bacterium]